MGSTRQPPARGVIPPRPPARRWHARAAQAILAGLGLLAVAGCGVDDGIGRRYSVSGRVSYKGKPLESGTVSFIPEESSGRVAAGSIAGGYYRLSTLSPGDGALPGKYLVTVIAKEGGPPGAKSAPNTPAYLKRLAASTKAAKNIIPTKYQSPRTSGLAREVEPRSNRFDFELGD